MAMPASYLKMWEQLDDSNRTQANEFIEFLFMKQCREKGQPREDAVQPIHFGALKGKIKMLDHFDDPLPGFEEYT